MMTQHARSRYRIAVVLAVLMAAAPSWAADEADDDLAGPDAAARAIAASRIAVAGACSDAAADLLVQGLGDTRTVRPAGAGYRAVPAGAAYREGDTTVADLCAEALASLGDAATAPLLAALDDPTRAEAHGRIIALLGQLCPREAHRPVLRYARRHVTARQPWDPQLSVAWLGEEVVPILIQALATDVLELQVVAAGDLGPLGDPRAYAPLLATVQRLAPLAATQPADHADRRRIVVFRSAVVSLAQVGGSSSYPHIAAYQSKLAACWDAPTREAMILALGSTRDGRAVEPLVALLAGADARARRTACEALARLGKAGAEATDALIDLLDTDDDALRRAAADALRAITGADPGDSPAAWKAWRDGPTATAPAEPAAAPP